MLIFMVLTSSLFGQMNYLASVEFIVDSLPELSIAELDKSISVERKQSSISTLLPHISGQANQEVGYEAYGLNEQELYQPTTLSLTLDQQLFDLRLFHQIAIAKSQENYSTVAYEQSLNSVMKSFSFDWAYLWRNSERERIIGDIVVITKQNLTNTEYRFEVGELTRTDVTKIASKHYGYLNNQSNIQKERILSFNKLEQIYQITPEQAPELPEFLRITVDEGRALKENPEYRLAEIVEEIADRITKQESTDFIPTISGSITAKRIWNSDNATLPDDYNDIGGAVNLTWSIFNGTEHYASLAAARYEQEKARLEREEIAREIQNRISDARQNVITSNEQVTISQQRLSAAKDVLDGTQSEYFSGTRTTTDLIIAQEEYLNAQLESVDITLNLFLAKIIYLETLGILTPETLEQLIITKADVHNE